MPWRGLRDKYKSTDDGLNVLWSQDQPASDRRVRQRLRHDGIAKDDCTMKWKTNENENRAMKLKTNENETTSMKLKTNENENRTMKLKTNDNENQQQQ